MFSNFAIGLLVGAGAGAWVYSKMQHRNGGLTNQSLMVAGIVGGILVLVITTLLGIIFKE